MITIVEETLVSKHLVKEFTLLVGGKEITVTKIWDMDNISNDYDTSIEVDEKDQENLTDEELEEINDFMEDQ